MSDVLIIGAGPCGLTMASELIRQGIDVRIIDQAEHPSIYSKALGLQPKTLEVFDRMGLIDSFLEKGLKIDHMNYYFQDKTASIALSYPEDVPYPFILVVPQSETEKILTQHLESLGKQVERSVSLKSIVPEERVILQHKDGNEEIVYPKWVVACDGAHSTVRNVMGIPFKGGSFSEAFVLCDGELVTTLAHNQGHSFLGEKGFCGIIPLPQENHFRLILPFKKDVQLDKNMVDVNFIQRIVNERIFGSSIKVKSTSWVSLFYIHRHIVPHLRYKNVFLAGDAAHVHSPAGGQGLNTSVQDAQNLAWKLALYLKGEGRSVLIDSYEKERLPVAQKVLDKTTDATRKLNYFQKHFTSFFFWILDKKAKNKKFIRNFSTALGELDLFYENSPIVKLSFNDYFWKGPLPGERAPDVDYAPQRKLFEDLKDPRHILLFFKKEGAEYFPEKMKSQYEKLVKVLIVASDEHGSELIHDQESKISHTYNAVPGTTYLIRPDGYIAYRQKKYDEKGMVRYLDKIFKMQS